MNDEHITNATIFTIDWAKHDRAAFLRSIPYSSKDSAGGCSLSRRANDVWSTDVSATDKRSVKAYLAGRGDYRALWWHLNLALHRLLQPQVALEQVMYAFHKRHHFMTIASLSLVRDNHDFFQAIRQHGVLSGVQCVIKLYRHPQGEQG